MSLPTLRNDLAKIYEPKAPAPSQRLATLKAARELRLNVYVAMAPTYPECDESDLAETLRAVRGLSPVTIFHEPINIRAENVDRINSHARCLGIKLKAQVFESPKSWQRYAIHALRTVENLGSALGISQRIHLWPDKSLSRSGLQALGAFAANASVRLDLDLQAQGVVRAAQADALVNESNKVLNPVQEGLNFQLSGWFFDFHTRFW